MMAPRFVLIDHSLKRIGGHHFDYALHVLHAARAQGFRTILATHRAFRSRRVLPPDCELHPLFPHVTYNRFTAYAADVVTGDAVPDAARAEAAGPGASGRPSWREHARSIVTWTRQVMDPSAERRVKAFERACRRLFGRVDVRSGDIVFLPTVSELDLLGITRFLKHAPRMKHVDFHLQFHFDVFEGREGGFGRQSGRLEAVRETFRLALDQAPDHRLHFYNTSDGLADQYNRLHVAPFRPLAYPINPAFLRDDEPGTGAGPESARPLQITCAGAARPEKGCRDLATLLRELWADVFVPGVAQLVVQTRLSRITSRPQLRIALPDDRHQRQHPPVRYVAHPLEPDDYVKLIRSADIGLLIYNGERYYARRAGVLCELLTAGVPVIVPAGCWLSEQIAEAVNEHTDELSTQLPTLSRQPLGTLTLAGAPERMSEELTRPPDATDALVEFRFGHTCQSGVYVQVECRQWDAAGNVLEVARRVVGRRGIGRPVRSMFHLHDGAVRLRVGFRNAYDDRTIPLAQTEISFRSAAHLPTRSCPLGRVGLIAPAAGDIPDLLRDMIRHYPHYRRSAAEFAVDWARRHDPLQTVRQLMDGTQAMPRSGERGALAAVGLPR